MRIMLIINAPAYGADEIFKRTTTFIAKVQDAS